MRHLILKTSNACPPHIPKQGTVVVCWLCNKEVPLETATTDENGRVMHEECYVLRLHLKQAC